MLGTIIRALIFLTVFLTIYKIIFDFLNKIEKKAIKSVNNVEEAIKLRKKLFLRRKRLFYSYFSIVALLVVLVPIIDNRFLIDSILLLVMLFVSIRYEYSKVAFYGNISWETPESFLEKHDRFYLYLRGFNSDIPFEEDRLAANQLFKESVFVEAVEYALNISCCALGMSKEIDGPIGASRVYVDDDEWKEKVAELMDKAEKIFILVNNRSSCIWEIERSFAMLDKTVFIVDDYNQYKSVKDYFKEKINLPESLDDGNTPFFFEYGKSPIPFSNTWEGYFDILGLSYESIEKENVNKRLSQKQENSEKRLWWVVIIIAIVVSVLLYFSH